MNLSVPCTRVHGKPHTSLSILGLCSLLTPRASSCYPGGLPRVGRKPYLGLGRCPPLAPPWPHLSLNGQEPAAGWFWPQGLLSDKWPFLAVLAVDSLSTSGLFFQVFVPVVAPPAYPATLSTWWGSTGLPSGSIGLAR